jgi:hypothetical protein
VSEKPNQFRTIYKLQQEIKGPFGQLPTLTSEILPLSEPSKMTEGIELQLLSGVVVLGLVTLTTLGVYRVWFHPLAFIPGPKAAALSTDWLYRASIGKYVEETLDVLHDEYSEFWFCSKIT